MAKFIILGSAGGFAVLDRYCTSIIGLVGNDSYLFDCGEPAAASIFRKGIDPFSIRSIFVSHMHTDHVSGLASVIASRSLAGRPKGKMFKPWSITRYDDWFRKDLWFPSEIIDENIPHPLFVHLPEEGIGAIRNYLDAVYLAPEVLPFEVDLMPMKVGRVYQDEQVTVTAVENGHLKVNKNYQMLPKTYPDIRLQSYSFLIEAEGKGLLYSGDIDHIEELNQLADRANVVILEMAHHDIEQIKPYFDRYDFDQLVLTHIHPGLEGHLKELVAVWNEPRIQIACDGFEIEL